MGGVLTGKREQAVTVVFLAVGAVMFLVSCANDNSSDSAAEVVPPPAPSIATEVDETASTVTSNTTEEAGGTADTRAPITTTDRGVHDSDDADDGVRVGRDPALGIENGVDITVAPEPIVYSEPVAFDEPGDFGDGLNVHIADLEAVDVVSALPGEIGGPSVLLALEFRNESGAAVDLGSVTADLRYADAVSAIPVSTPPADPVSGELSSGETAVGFYVFSLPLDSRSAVELTVRYSDRAPTVVFLGSVE